MLTYIIGPQGKSLIANGMAEQLAMQGKKLWFSTLVLMPLN